MKKYVYSKENQLVTVETDGLNKIDHFMVTGLIGNKYDGLVSLGLDLKMGDWVNIAKLKNIAKICKCKLEAYEGDKLIVDESVDFTDGEVSSPGIISGLKLAIAFNEQTYQSLVPAEYVDEHPYEEEKDNLPLLVAIFQKLEEKEGSEFELKMFVDNNQLTMNVKETETFKLSEDKKTATCSGKGSYFVFSIAKNLGITRPEKATWFKIVITYGGVTYEDKLFVTPQSFN